MTSCNAPGLRPVEDAIQSQLNLVQPITETEQLDITQALNRIVATDIHSPINVPPIENSSMDGYALAFSDVQTLQNNTQALEFECIGESLAGHPFQGELGANQCVRIMTGAVVPKGANTVIMQENTRRLENNKHTHILLTTPPKAEGQSVRRIGEDIEQGTVVIPQGTRLNAAHLSMLASIGVATVPVYRKIRVAVLATGDELTPPGTPLPPGAIYECNRVGLIAMLSKLNVDVLDLGIIADTPSAIRAAFERATESCDWVLSSGGVSVGDADYVKVVLDELGKIDFWKVAIKPGKPYAFGQLGDTFFSGLPGNPVSSFVTFHQLVIPALRKLSGESSHQLNNQCLQAQSVSFFKKHPGRTDYQRGRFFVDESGALKVTGPSKQASNMMSSFFNANCYIVLEKDRGNVDQGETVNILPFDPILQ